MQVSFFCTYLVVDALPIGIVITSDEQMETLTETFVFSKSIFPNNIFFGKFRPDVMALYEVFPESTLLLCLFDKKLGVFV